MLRKYKIIVFCLWLSLSLAGCSSEGGTSTPNISTIIPPIGTDYPVQYENNTGYPVQIVTQTNDKDFFVVPSEAALKVLSVAQKRALDWNKNAVLVGIPRLRQMETNLALPMGPQGWFFMFKDPKSNSPLEFYIEIINGQVAGTNEVQKVRVGPPPYTDFPIDLTKNLLDSPEIFKIFMANGGSEIIKGRGKVELDFQLLNIDGMTSPVWCLYPGSDINAKPYKCIDAISGKISPDPLEKFRK